MKLQSDYWKYPWAWIVIATLFLTLLNGPGGIRSQERIIVGTIDRAGVKKLLGAKDGPSIIIMIASWCGPCREELPALTKLYSKYRSDGLKMVGLSFEYGGRAAIQTVLDRFHVNFPVYCADDQVLRDYHISSIPMFFLIKDGYIVEKLMGRRTEKFLEGRIRELLK